MKSVKDLLESGDEVVQQLTTRFIDEEISWDEFYDLVKIRLRETGQDEDLVSDYDRAMKGV